MEEYYLNLIDKNGKNENFKMYKVIAKNHFVVYDFYTLNRDGSLNIHIERDEWKNKPMLNNIKKNNQQITKEEFTERFENYVLKIKK